MTPALTQCPLDAKFAVVKWGPLSSRNLRPLPPRCVALGWPQPSLSLAGSSMAQG